MLKRTLRWVIIGLIGLFIVIQVIPYGRGHTNPPVIKEPTWDSPQTRELAVRACFDCHSNETVWPWYSNLAPSSWLVQRDVDRARLVLNFSDWDRSRAVAVEAPEVIREGEMPLWYYVLLHPKARLSSNEMEAFIRGLEATLASGK
jgi:hypothetical protein